jgi:hypothetical protein
VACLTPSRAQELLAQVKGEQNYAGRRLLGDDTAEVVAEV